MSDYVYVKQYTTNQYGSLVLCNPEPLDEYNRERYARLLATHKNPEEQRKVKLRLLSEFTEIYAFDREHAVYPEPFGYFEDEEEKAELRRISLLNQDCVNYLGAIFAEYHTAIARSGEVQLLELSSFVVDFSEVFRTAYIDYACVLLNVPKQVHIKIHGESDEPGKPIIEESIAYTGKKISVPGAEKGKNVIGPPHAVSATYIFPALIEQGLTQYLENSIISKWLDETGNQWKILSALEEKERNLYHAFKWMRDVGDGKISGDRRKMLKAIWDIGEKYGVLINRGGMKNVMYGKHGGDDLTLGDMLALDYTATQIRPEYLAVLRFLFGRKDLNLRNKIAHGDRSTFDYLHLGYVAIMYQLMLDIATGDVFI